MQNNYFCLVNGIQSYLISNRCSMSTLLRGNQYGYEGLPPSTPIPSAPLLPLIFSSYCPSVPYTVSTMLTVSATIEHWLPVIYMLLWHGQALNGTLKQCFTLPRNKINTCVLPKPHINHRYNI